MVTGLDGTDSGLILIFSISRFLLPDESTFGFFRPLICSI